MVKRILVIDDEPGIIAFFKACLKAWGYEVETSRDASEGLKMLEKRPYDGITLGLIMPFTNGVEFLRKFRQKDSFLPVLIISGGSTQLSDSDFRFVRANAQAFLSKPFQVGDFRSIVYKCFGAASSV